MMPTWIPLLLFACLLFGGLSPVCGAGPNRPATLIVAPSSPAGELGPATQPSQAARFRQSLRRVRRKQLIQQGKLIVPEITDISLLSDGSLVGVLFDDLGKPVEKSVVVLMQGDERIASATTDSAGFWALDRVRPGVYRVAAGDQEELFRFWPTGACPRELPTLAAIGTPPARLEQDSDAPETQAQAAEPQQRDISVRGRFSWLRLGIGKVKARKKLQKVAPSTVAGRPDTPLK